MRKSAARAFALLLFAAPPPPGRAASAPTLCETGETVVFSCATGARVASVCASNYISKTSGYLQYRFGQKDKVEMSYPLATAKPAELFESGTLIYSGGGGAWLRFSNGPFRYSIFSAIGKWGPKGQPAEAAGVFVEKDGRNVANLPCHGAAAGELGPDFFEKIGLKEAPPDAEFKIPEAFLPK
jgi:hypothetical protein